MNRQFANALSLCLLLLGATQSFASGISWAVWIDASRGNLQCGLLLKINHNDYIDRNEAEVDRSYLPRLRF